MKCFVLKEVETDVAQLTPGQVFRRETDKDFHMVKDDQNFEPMVISPVIAQPVELVF